MESPSIEGFSLIEMRDLSTKLYFECDAKLYTIHHLWFFDCLPR